MSAFHFTTKVPCRWRAYPLLSQFPGSLVLGVSEKFNAAALIRGEAANLPHDFPTELCALAKVALHARDSGFRHARGDLVASVEAHGDYESEVSKTDKSEWRALTYGRTFEELPWASCWR
jgi:hypothetical protein